MEADAISNDISTDSSARGRSRLRSNLNNDKSSNNNNTLPIQAQQDNNEKASTRLASSSSSVSPSRLVRSGSVSSSSAKDAVSKFLSVRQRATGTTTTSSSSSSPPIQRSKVVSAQHGLDKHTHCSDHSSITTRTVTTTASSSVALWSNSGNSSSSSHHHNIMMTTTNNNNNNSDHQSTTSSLSSMALSSPIAVRRTLNQLKQQQEQQHQQASSAKSSSSMSSSPVNTTTANNTSISSTTASAPTTIATTATTGTSNAVRPYPSSTSTSRFNPSHGVDASQRHDEVDNHDDETMEDFVLVRMGRDHHPNWGSSPLSTAIIDPNTTTTTTTTDDDPFAAFVQQRTLSQSILLTRKSATADALSLPRLAAAAETSSSSSSKPSSTMSRATKTISQSQQQEQQPTSHEQDVNPINGSNANSSRNEDPGDPDTSNLDFQVHRLSRKNSPTSFWDAIRQQSLPPHERQALPPQRDAQPSDPSPFEQQQLVNEAEAETQQQQQQQTVAKQPNESLPSQRPDLKEAAAETLIVPPLDDEIDFGSSENEGEARVKIPEPSLLLLSSNNTTNNNNNKHPTSSSLFLRVICILQAELSRQVVRHKEQMEIQNVKIRLRQAECDRLTSRVAQLALQLQQQRHQQQQHQPFIESTWLGNGATPLLYATPERHDNTPARRWWESRHPDKDDPMSQMTTPISRSGDHRTKSTPMSAMTMTTTSSPSSWLIQPWQERINQLQSELEHERGKVVFLQQELFQQHHPTTSGAASTTLSEPHQALMLGKSLSFSRQDRQAPRALSPATQGASSPRQPRTSQSELDLTSMLTTTQTIASLAGAEDRESDQNDIASSMQLQQHLDLVLLHLQQSVLAFQQQQQDKVVPSTSAPTASKSDPDLDEFIAFRARGHFSEDIQQLMERLITVQTLLDKNEREENDDIENKNKMDPAAVQDFVVESKSNELNHVSPTQEAILAYKAKIDAAEVQEARCVGGEDDIELQLRQAQAFASEVKRSECRMAASLQAAQSETLQWKDQCGQFRADLERVQHEMEGAKLVHQQYKTKVHTIMDSAKNRYKSLKESSHKEIDKLRLELSRADRELANRKLVVEISKSRMDDAIQKKEAAQKELEHIQHHMQRRLDKADAMIVCLKEAFGTSQATRHKLGQANELVSGLEQRLMGQRVAEDRTKLVHSNDQHEHITEQQQDRLQLFDSQMSLMLEEAKLETRSLQESLKISQSHLDAKDRELYDLQQQHEELRLDYMALENDFHQARVGISELQSRVDHANELELAQVEEDEQRMAAILTSEKRIRNLEEQLEQQRRVLDLQNAEKESSKGFDLWNIALYPADANAGRRDIDAPVKKMGFHADLPQDADDDHDNGNRKLPLESSYSLPLSSVHSNQGRESQQLLDPLLTIGGVGTLVVEKNAEDPEASNHVPVEATLISPNITTSPSANHEVKADSWAGLLTELSLEPAPPNFPAGAAVTAAATVSTKVENAVIMVPPEEEERLLNLLNDLSLESHAEKNEAPVESQSVTGGGGTFTAEKIAEHSEESDHVPVVSTLVKPEITNASSTDDDAQVKSLVGLLNELSLEPAPQMQLEAAAAEAAAVVASTDVVNPVTTVVPEEEKRRLLDLVNDLSLTPRAEKNEAPVESQSVAPTDEKDDTESQEKKVSGVLKALLFMS